MWGRREKGYRIFQVTETTAAIEQCRTAEKMEDLFDEIVAIYNNKERLLLDAEKVNYILDGMLAIGYKIMGAIWTQAGLTYVARYISGEWKTINTICDLEN